MGKQKHLETETNGASGTCGTVRLHVCVYWIPSKRRKTLV